MEKSSGGQTRLTVLFDGDCGLCQRTVGFLRRLDLLRRVQFKDVVADWEEIHRRFPSLSQEACLTEMHVVAPDGKVFLGFDGYRALAWDLPLGWVIVPFLYFPGVPWAGRRVYRAVAGGRSRGGCPVPHRK